jgi:NAD-dependent DNA ligase
MNTDGPRSSTQPQAPKEIAARIEELRDVIRHHLHLYHVLDAPEISMH